ncbi:MAG: DUF423 domain-containing protein [Deltaproteobacteria bacterium]|nr:MAG: DUF423 domain-containing protein [Deltaproteobacteria bacterium]
MKKFLCLGALSCFLGVMAGALGAHTLKNHIIRMDGITNFSTATDYMFYHGFALIVVALMEKRYPQLAVKYAGWLFVAGTILFQGNLFTLSLVGASPLSFLTPVGGVCLMAAWLLLAINALRIPR